MVERIATASLDADPHAVAFEAPRTVCLRLDAGEKVPAHDHPGQDVVVVVLDGELSVRVAGERHALAAGEALRFDGEREVMPTTGTGARALVVLCERGAERDE